MLKSLTPEGITVLAASTLTAAVVVAIHRWRNRKGTGTEAQQLVEALRQAIATVELGETQQAVLKNRHLPAIERVAKRSAKFKAGIFWLSMSIISTNFLLQVLGSFGPTADFNPARWLGLITAIQSFLLAFKELSGLEPRAISTQETLGKLLSEAWSYFGLSGQYRNLTHASAAPEMFGDMENILLDNALSSFPRRQKQSLPQEEPDQGRGMAGAEIAGSEPSFSQPAGFRVPADRANPGEVSKSIELLSKIAAEIGKD